MSLIQRTKRRTSRKFSREVLREMAWLDGRTFGWELREQYYPYPAHDFRAKRAYFASRLETQ